MRRRSDTGGSLPRGAGVPVLAYHSVAPGETIDPRRFRTHAQALARSGMPSLAPRDLEQSKSGFLLTFDDGFADLWTHALPILAEYGLRATVFAISSRAGEGPARPQGEAVFPGRSSQAFAEAAQRPGPHPAFLRWSELEALEATRLVTVHSHSHTHAMGWVGDEIAGFHLGGLGRTHWSLPQCTGGDVRVGIPLYRRGSALAHRLYRDEPTLRDLLADWVERRGGEAYVREAGAERVSGELSGVARRFREDRGPGGRWETDDEREGRTLDEIVRAREVLEHRLAGRRDELCLPWGEYDGVTLECAKRAGVRRVYTLDRGPNAAGRPGFTVNRFEPRARGLVWIRSRLWIYRSTFRAELYRRVCGRPARAES